MRKTVRPPLWTLALLAAFLVALADSSPRLTLQKVDVSQLPEVHVFFTVTDSQGQPRLGLTGQEVRVTIDGAPQAVISLQSAGAGGETLWVVLVFDKSGSMKHSLEKTKEAGLDFISRLSPGDQVAVLSFDDEVSKELEFTEDRSRAEEAIQSIALGRDTALYDALQEAMGLFQEAAGRRQAIVVLSDGKDTKSRLKREDVLEKAKVQDVPVFTIGLGSQVDARELENLAQETGGRFYRATGASDLLGMYQVVAEQLTNQYLLRFVSTPGLDGRWHSLKIQVEPSGEETCSAEQAYLASTGPGISRASMTLLEQQAGKREIVPFLLLGALAGLGTGLLLVIIIRVARPAASLNILLLVGLTLSFLLLGGLVGWFAFLLR